MQYKLDRQVLVEYYPVELAGLTHINLISLDLEIGGEFIISAQDLLEHIEWIEGKLVGSPTAVHHSNIELVYIK